MFIQREESSDDEQVVSKAPPIALVVEPSPTLGSALTKVLEKRGLTVIREKTIAEGLAAAVARRPAVILVSRSACELPGEALSRALGTSPTLSATPIAILTSHRPEEIDVDAIGVDQAISLSDDLGTQVAGFLEAVGLGDVTAPPSLPERILLADDADMMRRLVSRVLHAAGATVTLAEDGLEAVDFAKRETFDLILLDIEMPGLDGPGTLRALREMNVTAPIVALTGHGEEYRAEAETHGFDGLLDKRQPPSGLVEGCRAFHGSERRAA